MLSPKQKNISEWYNEVVLKSEMADYGPVKGTMVIRPLAFGIWENIQKVMNPLLAENKVQNAYFPLFIPESFLKKEKEHIKGFSPELAVVTTAGGEELKEKLIVRPTSETIMYAMYAKWIKSWRDLPLKINQWNNVVRWEKRTYLFLRTSEFLWQEGHTAHATYKEAEEEALKMLKIYEKIYQNYLAIYGVSGIKSETEKFAGADKTYSYEILIPSGKVLQGATSHNLGQNFSKVFNIKFLGKDKKEYFVWQTSWGLSTRAIGALILVHGDDKGLILPPKISPIQIIIIPIWSNSKEKTMVLKEIKKIKSILEAQFKTDVDLRDDKTPGWKFNEWELKGIPLRCEIGPKDIKAKQVIAVRRDTGEKMRVGLKNLNNQLNNILNQIQNNLLNRSKEFTKKNTYLAQDYNKFKQIMKTTKGFIKAFWCGDSQCEENIKNETKATVRVLPLGAKKEKGKCVYCGRPAFYQWLFGQSY